MQLRPRGDCGQRETGEFFESRKVPAYVTAVFADSGGTEEARSQQATRGASTVSHAFNVTPYLPVPNCRVSHICHLPWWSQILVARSEDYRHRGYAVRQQADVIRNRTVEIIESLE